jgi:hypothetical protein
LSDGHKSMEGIYVALEFLKINYIKHIICIGIKYVILWQYDDKTTARTFILKLCESNIYLK